MKAGKGLRRPKAGGLWEPFLHAAGAPAFGERQAVRPAIHDRVRRYAATASDPGRRPCSSSSDSAATTPDPPASITAGT